MEKNQLVLTKPRLSVLTVIEEGTLPGIAEQPRIQETGVEVLGMRSYQLEEKATDFALMAFTSNPSSSSSSNSERVKQRKQAANLAVQKKQEEQTAQTWERFSEIKHAFTDNQYQPEEIQELMCKILEDVRNTNEELSEFTNSSSWDRPMIDDDQEHSIQFRLYLENSSKAIAPVLPIEEPEYSLSMGNEHVDTILETESDELIKSSVENLVLIPSKYEVTSDNESECDVPVNNESSPIFVTFSNPLFDCNDDFTSSDDELLSNEDKNLMRKLLIRLSSLSPSPILVEDCDSHMEEIDLFLATDDLMPPGIENEDYDSERDIYFLEELFSNDPILLPKNEPFNFDHYEPSFPRPPLEPPDVEVFFDFELDSGELILAVMNNIDELIEDECFDPGGGGIYVFANVEDDDYFPFILVI
uniref:Reverse transcriptase domain-containing protein n=1 Tax=Tanacetum cinerariifolium TaxID=118510 RepID=A0A6L2NP28_TANCI|nr:hypothetical protein [Tanacetum cinerariifolium]